MSEKPLVVITDFINDELSIERQHLSDVAELAVADANLEEELRGQVEDAEALMVYHNLSVSGQTIDRLKRCKLIVRCGVGFDNIDHVRARERDITVANVPDYGTEDVANSAVGMALTLMRGVHTLNSRLQRGQGPWSYTQVAPLKRLRGEIFGIVGLGRIGTAVALRAKALGMDVVYYDPYKPDGYDKSLGLRRVETLEELLAAAFVVSLHCPLSETNRHMINGQTLACMRPDAYLVNTARGAVVDTSVIPQAIAAGKLAGAAIDVLEGEPPAADHPLLVAWRDPSHPCYHRLIVNPHSAFYCEEGFTDIRLKGSLACRKAILGQPIPNIVN